MDSSGRCFPDSKHDSFSAHFRSSPHKYSHVIWRTVEVVAAWPGMLGLCARQVRVAPWSLASGTSGSHEDVTSPNLSDCNHDHHDGKKKRQHLCESFLPRRLSYWPTYFHLYTHQRFLYSVYWTCFSVWVFHSKGQCHDS